MCNFLSQVLNEYKARKSAFLIDVFECATYLEDLTGLTELHKTLDTKEVIYYHHYTVILYNYI